MAVYVDELQYPTQQAKNITATRPQMFCHMYADPDAESMRQLHDMAANIGLVYVWFKTPAGPVPHYTLVPSRRALAVELGALQHTDAEAMEKWLEIRQHYIRVGQTAARAPRTDTPKPGVPLASGTNPG